jgi:hypothetical protein
MTSLPAPPLHALFQRRIDGDDALLRLARLRFEQAGLAAEAYAGSPDELEGLLAFAPAGARPPTVHLSRQIDVLRPADRRAVADFARRFGGRVSGFVVHDRADLPGRLDELEAAAGELSDVLERSGPARLFVEYAAGCEVAEFVETGRRLAGVERVGVCVDTGHVGIREARRHFARARPDAGVDLAALVPDDPRLPDLVGDVQAAVAAGLTAVLELTTALADQGRAAHYHLHDGHPLVRGLADHRGFLTRLPVPFEHRGRRSLDPLYGPSGLAAIVRTATAAYGPERVSFTLEIHQADGRLPVGDAAALFRHWRDLTNAERMNAWLETLAENAALVRGALGSG